MELSVIKPMISRARNSRERRVLRLEEALVLLNGRSGRVRIAKTPGDVIVWRGTVGLKRGHQRGEPGLCDAEARVNQRARHWQF